MAKKSKKKQKKEMSIWGILSYILLITGIFGLVSSIFIPINDKFISLYTPIFFLSLAFIIFTLDIISNMR